MEARLQKWGNSDGIRIPKSFLKELGLKTNDMVELIQLENKIIITKSNKPSISLEKRFKEYNGKDKVEPYDWGSQVGREIW